MRTLGIDLSANPLKTGACTIDWSVGTVEFVRRPATDDDLVRAMGAVDLVGIDIPLGWPDGFVEAVAAHHDGASWPVIDVESPFDREPLRFRRTDIAARQGGSLPLSVSTDRIGVAAMRGARLQGLARRSGLDVDRSGTSGRIAEVYPAAALRRWGLRSSGYKGRANAAACALLGVDLAARCGPLAPAVGALVEGCDDDGLDAIVCAIVARAVLLGKTVVPAAEDVEVARREGWIHVPTVDIATIVEG